jgi:dynein heavy chain
METKRRAFARFYFLSDDQLLEILADTKDPTKVQNHMNKCFEAIKYVVFKPGNVEVVGMISPEEEKVMFSTGVNVEAGDKKGNVEVWLLEIEA